MKAKKTVYQVADNDGTIIDVRKSNREYTHAVALIYNQRHTSEGWVKVEEFISGASYCGSLELAQRELSRIQTVAKKHSKQNQHLPVNGKIIPVKKI